MIPHDGWCDRCKDRPAWKEVGHGGRGLGVFLCLNCMDWMMAQLRDELAKEGKFAEARDGWASWRESIGKAP